MWVVGVDGNIAFAGSPSDGNFTSTVESEMAKVRYPGLGLTELNRALTRAGTAWARQEFGEAMEKAQDELDDLPEEESEWDADEREIAGQAQSIIDRATAKLEGWAERAGAAYDEGDYLTAFKLWTLMSEHFEDTERADEADDKLRAMRRDRDVRDVLEAQQSVAALWEGTDLGNARDRATTEALMQRLADRHEDNMAGTMAREYAELLAAMHD